MNTYFFTLLMPRLTRELDVHEDQIGGGHTQVWREACECLSSGSYTVRGTTYSVHADWTQAARHVESLHLEARTNSSQEHLEPRAEIRVIAEVSEEHGWLNAHAGYVVHQFMSECFLALNIAAPGSCSFRAAELYQGNIPNPLTPQLGGVQFDRAWIESLDGRYPHLQNLPCSLVVDWLKRVNIGSTQIATSGTMRALFALLHISLESIVTPAQLMWLGHALEGLYHVPNALSFNLVRDRAALLLKATPEQAKSFATQLRKFYDARNAFAHGGMEIQHPSLNEQLDPTLLDKHDGLFERVQFGLQLVLASFQAMCREGMIELRFREVLDLQ